MEDKELETFLKAYLVTMLWSSNDESTDDGGEPLDANYTPEDISEESLKACQEECEAFLSHVINGQTVRDLLAALPLENFVNHDGLPDHLVPFSSAGYDFWLTRNGHGAGFWDRPEMYGEELAKDLTGLCKEKGGVWAYVTAGKIYV